MTNRAVLYLRLSVAQDAIQSDSIARQEADLRSLCDRHGWPVARVLVDDGLSGRKVRANATEALRMLREREADVLAVWKLDRWGRRGAADVADLVAVLDERKDARFVALQDGLDSTQQAWRLIASVLSEVGRAEAENTSTRVRASVRANRQAGRFVGGTVPFGFVSVAREGGGRTLAIDPVERAVVEEVAERLLGDESQWSILEDLTRRAVPTTRSPLRLARLRGESLEGLSAGTWSHAGLSAVWTGEALLGRSAFSYWQQDDSGQMTRRWDVVRDASGAPLAPFPALLDLVTVQRLRDRLRDAKRPTERRPRRPRRARLLSEVIFCVCGQRLWVTTSGGRTVYSCRQVAGRCSGTNMKAENAERAVVTAYLEVAGDAAEWEVRESVPVDAAEVTLAAVRAELAEALADLGSSGVDEAASLRRISALKRRREEILATPREVLRELVPTGRTLGQAWHESPEGDRRRLLLEAIDHVVLRPTERKGHTGYHPERLQIQWRG